MTLATDTDQAPDCFWDDDVEARREGRDAVAMSVSTQQARGGSYYVPSGVAAQGNTASVHVLPRVEYDFKAYRARLDELVRNAVSKACGVLKSANLTEHRRQVEVLAKDLALFCDKLQRIINTEQQCTDPVRPLCVEPATDTEGLQAAYLALLAEEEARLQGFLAQPSSQTVVHQYVGLEEKLGAMLRTATELARVQAVDARASSLRSASASRGAASAALKVVVAAAAEELQADVQSPRDSLPRAPGVGMDLGMDLGAGMDLGMDLDAEVFGNAGSTLGFLNAAGTHEEGVLDAAAAGAAGIMGAAGAGAAVPGSLSVAAGPALLPGADSSAAGTCTAAAEASPRRNRRTGTATAASPLAKASTSAAKRAKGAGDA